MGGLANMIPAEWADHKVLEFRGRRYLGRPTLPAEVWTGARDLAGWQPRGRRDRKQHSDASTDQCVRLLRSAFAWPELQRLQSACGDDDEAWREVIAATASMYKLTDLVGVSSNE